MTEKLIAKISIQIDAPVSDVWQALITPDTIEKYFFGTRAESDWKPGSPLTFKGTWEGKEYADKGKILKNEPDKLLQFSYWSSMSGKEDKPENYAVVTYSLSGGNGATQLSVTQDNITNEEGRQHSEQNWTTVLNNLKNLLENRR